MRELIAGMPAAEVAALDAGLVSRLGLASALGMVRMRGLSGIVFAIRRRAIAALAARSAD